MTSYIPFRTNPLFWYAWTENSCSKIPLFILPSLQTFSRNNPAHTMTPRRAAATVDFTLQQAFKIYTAAIAAAILMDGSSMYSRVIRSKSLEKLKENGQKWAKSDDESVDWCAAYVPTIPQCNVVLSNTSPGCTTSLSLGWDKKRPTFVAAVSRVSPVSTSRGVSVLHLCQGAAAFHAWFLLC